MCGIVGYVGKDNALPIVLSGLKSLEYRGYDSAGVAYVNKNKLKIKKEVGRIASLTAKINLEEDTHLSIGHTRWATHGKPSIKNSHPHTSGAFTVVHNGIIENYLEIKNKLIKEGVKFKSEVDTEVIPALLDYNYKKEKNILKCILKTVASFKGSYALGIICHDDLEHIYGVRKDSPLIVANGKNGNFIASDVPAILDYTNKYMLLNNNEILKMGEHIEIFNSKLESIKPKVLTFNGEKEDAKLDGYKHYMLKEIHEDAKVYLDTLNYYVKDGKFLKTMPNFKKYKNIHIVGCGSAYYVGKIGKYLIEEYAGIPVTVEIASEYRYKKNFYDKNTLVIVISQSGETADSLASLRKANKDGIDTLGIINVFSSSIAREAKYTMYVKAGAEIAVATTKAFIAQLTLISLIATKMSGDNSLLKHFNGLDKVIEKVLKTNYLEYAKLIYKHDEAFYIGRLVDYAISLEGSLKLKETAYINSMAYEAGELKHGTISLIKKDTIVIGIATKEEVISKTISNLKEVMARGAKVIYITNKDVNGDFYHYKIILPKVHDLVMPIITVIPLQLISYEVAKLRGCDIDKPRNLAKSVTVE